MEKMTQTGLRCCVAIAVIFTFVEGLEHKARYQPELDWVTVDPYINNPRLFKLQVNCIIEDGPCDIVGRWVKPRVAAALLGECILCTPHQHGEVNKFLAWVQENRPEIFRRAVVKYVTNNGISLPPDQNYTTVTLKPQDPVLHDLSISTIRREPIADDETAISSPTTYSPLLE